MEMTTHTLSESEKRVDETIRELTAPYASRLKLLKEDYMSGVSWLITPNNPNAATIFVYGVDDTTINVMIDDKYWLEMFVNKKTPEKDVALFKEQLKAVMEGLATGWHGNMDEERAKTLLEISNGDKKPYRWSGNLLFTSRLKKKPGTIEKHYENY